MSRLHTRIAWHVVLCGSLGLIAGVGAAVPAAGEDIFNRFSHLQHPVVVQQPAPVEPTSVEPEPEAEVPEPVRGDLAQYFPNLKMSPILAATPDVNTAAPEATQVGRRDFAAIVEEAKREAFADARVGRGSVAAGLPDGVPGRGTPATLASHAKPNCRTHGHGKAPQSCPPCPPRQTAPGQGQPGQPQIATPSAPILPLPEAAGSDAIVPTVPDLRRNLPSSQDIARADVGGMRANWADAPNIVGDGCAPQGTAGQLAVGRLLIVAPQLTQSGDVFQNSGVGANVNVVTNGAYNNVQALQAAGYGKNPAFALPALTLGNVPGTPPTTVQTGTVNPGAGIVPAASPSSFLAAANHQFATNPNLNTGSYSSLSPKTVYDASHSGILQNPVPAVGTPTYDALMYYNYVVDANVVLPGYAVGFVKLTENQSPIPRDRVYMTYSYFKNANFYPTRADVNRFMPGFEKTFYDGWTSVEIRTPFAATLSNGQTIMPGGAGVSEYRDIQFGNMSVIFKTLVWEEKTWAFTTGMQVMLPTANNTYVNGQNALGQNIQNVYVANESVHLMPFLGGIWAPNERWFNQGLLQVETDANGNLAYVNNNFETGIAGRDLTQVGRIRYPNFMYISLGTGYWLYKDKTQNFTGFSPVMELHVNQALGEYCPIQAYGYQLGPNLGQVSVTNGLVGCNFEWGERSTLTFAYVTPLGGGVDRFFDGEFRALYNWRFGPQNRLTRAQF